MFIVYFSMYFNQYIDIRGSSKRNELTATLKNMGSQLRWLERTPDKREVDGSIPFEPTTKLIITLSFKFWNYKQVVQGKRGRIYEIVLVYIE